MPAPRVHRSPPEVRRLLGDLVIWALSRPDVAALALVGSYARGQATPASDVDVVVLAAGYAELAADPTWFLALRPGSRPLRSATWGPVLERRFATPSGLVVELGLAPPAWADVPLDPGTRRVLQDGHRILHDPHGLLGRAADAAHHPPAGR